MSNNNQRIEISIVNVSFTDVKLISTNLLGSRNVSCGGSLACQLTTSSNIKSVMNVTFPYDSFELTNINQTNISFPIDLYYNVSDEVLQSNSSKFQPFKADARFTLQGSKLINYNLSSPSMSSLENIEYIPPSNLCINATVDEILYALSLRYNATASVVIYNGTVLLSGDDLNLKLIQVFPSSYNFIINNNVAYTFFLGEINANAVQTSMYNIFPHSCNASEKYTAFEYLPPANDNSTIAIQNDYSKLLSNTTFLSRFIYNDYDFLSLKIYDCFKALAAIVIVFFPVFFWVRPAGGRGERDSRIKDKISQYFNRDPFDLITFGNFIDKKHTTVKQIVINDVTGVKIFSQDGALLFEKKDFCNKPFMTLKIFDNDCDITSPNFRGVDCSGIYSCEGYDYWHDGILYGMSFNAYDNHNKHFGGIKVGDFDGDGVDDLWCHYPGNALDYNPKQANQIIFAPLYNRTNRERCDTITDLYPSGWCSNGVVKVGDFNADYQDDVICITNEGKFYILYGARGMFVSASDDIAGLIKIPNITDSNYVNAGWDITKNVIVGDFNGDKRSDLFLINDLKILYGQSSNYFSLTKLTAQNFSNFVIVEGCMEVTVNRLAVVNNNGVDKITCFIKEKTTKPNSGGGLLKEVLQFFVPFKLFTFSPSLFFNIKNAIQSNHYKSTGRKFIAQDSQSDTESNLQLNSYSTVSAKKIFIFVNDLEISYPNNMDDFEQKSMTVNHDFNLYSMKTTSFKTEPQEALQLVKNIYFPYSVMNINEYDLEVSAVSTTYLTSPENNEWSNDSVSRNQLLVDLSARWKISKGELIDYQVNSNEIDLYYMKVSTTGKSCFNNTLSQIFKPVRVAYFTRASMQVESDGVLIIGDELKVIANNVVSDYELSQEDDTIIVPINGYMDINIPGVSYASIEHCV